MTGEPPEQSHREQRHRSKLCAWFQLLRVPNLFTVWGDPAVGFTLAAAGASSFSGPEEMILKRSLAICVSLLLYSAGVMWNDLFDLAEDRRERSDRPLPAGEIHPITAAVVAIILAAISVAVAAIIGRPTLYVTLALGLLVLAYNARAKRNAVLGPLTMGLCRGMSVLVGASAVGSFDGPLWPVLWVIIFFVVAYVAAITFLAASETQTKPTRAKASMILAVTIAWFAAS